MHKISGWVSLVFACSLSLQGQGTVPARMIVTTGHVYGQEPPMLMAKDLVVTQNDRPVKVTALLPLRGDRAGLELYVLVDNCSNCEAGPQFEELARFIQTQPATTSVGVAYIQNGKLEVALEPTSDHARAVKALSAPEGSKPSSPYDALADLIKGWKQGSARRAVLMISTGIDPAETNPESAQSKSAEAALRAAERAEVTIYAIYHPSADYLSTDLSKILAGQIQLSHVASNSGGEAYFLNFGPLLSLAPFLGDVDQHLANQYLLEFPGYRGSSPGELQTVRVKSTAMPELDLMAPDKIVVGGRTPQ
ncbi:MAG TPA: hypothetical protein VGU25_03910 [Acidobacteriaceae bacterium]|nr:hypothetical protein [Acidobacteriaceae bacterium]